MFNDDYLKFETNMVIIDVMIQSLDEVIQFICTNHVQTNDIKQLVSKIFRFCENMIEDVLSFSPIYTLSKQHLLNSISIVHKYWEKNDFDLFTTNWLLFVALWNDAFEGLKNKTPSNAINHFSIN